MAIAYLGLGSNLGDRAENIARALEALQAAGLTLLSRAPLYETEPWGLVDQPRFVNSACAVETSLCPLALLDLCKHIERQLGRTETVRNGPRIIDLDILLYDDQVVDLPRLHIPHLGLLLRATALVPLADIAADVVVPTSCQSVAQHLAALGDIKGLAIYPPGLSECPCNDPTLAET